MLVEKVKLGILDSQRKNIGKRLNIFINDWF